MVEGIRCVAEVFVEITTMNDDDVSKRDLGKLLIQLNPYLVVVAQATQWSLLLGWGLLIVSK